MVRLFFAPVLVAAIISLHTSSARAIDEANDLARSLQSRYDGVKDFSADFTHTYRGGALRKQITERGRLLIKKPGRMRWDYTAPEDKTFVSDGSRMYSYIPQDRQVIVTTVPRENQAAAPALFLAGKGDLTRDFTPSMAAAPAGFPADSKALKLVPKSPQREYDWLVLVVDPTTLRLRGLVTTDAQGGTSSFSFGNLKENLGLSDKTFEFKIPRGVDVITDTPRS